MKQQSGAAVKISRWMSNSIAMLLVLMLPAITYSQTGPPPPGPGGNGGSPDPLGGVPFDNNMTLVFLAAAVVFAVIVLKRKIAKEKTQLN